MQPHILHNPKKLNPNISSSIGKINPHDDIGEFAVIFDGKISNFNGRIVGFRNGEYGFVNPKSSDWSGKYVGWWKKAPKNGARRIDGEINFIADKKFVETFGNTLAHGWVFKEPKNKYEDGDTAWGRLDFYSTDISNIYLAKIKRDWATPQLARKPVDGESPSSTIDLLINTFEDKGSLKKPAIVLRHKRN